MREGTSIHKALIGIELFEISTNLIFKLRNSHTKSEHVFMHLPKYCLNDYGNIMISEYYYQFTGLSEEEENKKHLFFNLNTLDTLLQEELNNCDVDNIFDKNLDFKFILSKFAPQSDEKIVNFAFSNVEYIMIEMIYETNYDHNCGGYDTEKSVNIIGYLDNELQYRKYENE